ncbi:unnamed protein product [Prorocentrum cordatum]|uniref:Uncharacterized protein n=1 Tax=Prorocentrum cordatum TaxID=2364126 RepID=A0ABN9RIB2_9DINO|nr:unnamed protein product [Polarella glacialis]
MLEGPLRTAPPPPPVGPACPTSCAAPADPRGYRSEPPQLLSARGASPERFWSEPPQLISARGPRGGVPEPADEADTLASLRAVLHSSTGEEADALGPAPRRRVSARGAAEAACWASDGGAARGGSTSFGCDVAKLRMKVHEMKAALSEEAAQDGTGWTSCGAGPRRCPRRCWAATWFSTMRQVMIRGLGHERLPRLLRITKAGISVRLQKVSADPWSRCCTLLAACPPARSGPHSRRPPEL